jgi:adenosylmethionine-8-amino-7-oxononanoate aminotransferase
VLLVSDEVICAFGRLGHYFGAERYGYRPDIITFAKGVTSPTPTTAANSLVYDAGSLK